MLDMLLKSVAEMEKNDQKTVENFNEFQKKFNEFQSVFAAKRSEDQKAIKENMFGKPFKIK